ncbi:nuclear transport factor 2 family protein [Micromonospora sp. NPDC048898]|uniref:nuclear transport factor 2 family protein n=1 Tax=Micromonospora sp. NPDC048898 TaxID=3364260 RepID=UPI0037105D7B
MAPTRTFTDLYVEVQQFYARQMRQLDDRKLEAYAETFTEDAEFGHTPGREPARTRAGIVADLFDFHKKFENDPVQRRHWFNMIDVEPQADGSIRSTCYALVVTTRPNGTPTIAPSCVVNDILVRGADDELLTKYRRVDHDQLF